jgi:acetyl esterase/lipase
MQQKTMTRGAASVAALSALLMAGAGAPTRGTAAAAAPPVPPSPDPQMKAVLNQLAALKPKPIEKLTPAEARKQPGPPQAVKALLKNQGRSTAPEPVGSVKDTTIPGPAGTIPVRIYTPAGAAAAGTRPTLVYFHGGGWVIASIQAYDSSCRALANAADAVVVSVGYRMAPEHRFPAAHEDSFAATQYIMKNAGKYGGDPKRVAVVGESAGGNLAAAVCLMARDRKALMPFHQVLVYPIADTSLATPSYQQNAKAKPLNKPMMAWFFRHTIKEPDDKQSKYLDILDVENLKGLPPATIITAEIDPLRSEGKAYAERLAAAEVPVRYRDYQGVAHEFFGMGAVLDKAKDAVAFAAGGRQGRAQDRRRRTDPTGRVRGRRGRGHDPAAPVFAGGRTLTWQQATGRTPPPSRDSSHYPSR